MTLEEAINRMNTTDNLSELCDMILQARELIEEEYQKNKSRVFRMLNYDAPMVNGDANANQHNSNALNDDEQRINALEGDAISRQAVLEIAKSSKSNWIDNSVLFKRVNELPSVNLQEPKWIPVSERLPNFAGAYLVTRYFPNNVMNPTYLVDACFFDGADTWHNDNRINHERKYLTNVVAWLEEPEPYKAESEVQK